MPKNFHRIYVHVQDGEVVFVMNKTMTEAQRCLILEALPTARVYEGRYGHTCYAVERPRRASDADQSQESKTG